MLSGECDDLCQRIIEASVMPHSGRRRLPARTAPRQDGEREVMGGGLLRAIPRKDSTHILWLPICSAGCSDR